MIQDIFPHKIYNQYDPSARPCEADYMLCFDGSRLLIKDTFETTGEVEFPKGSDLGVIYDYTYLFAIDYERFFLIRTLAKVPEGFTFVDAKEIRGKAKTEKYRVFVAMTGKHLSDWYHDTKFCGRCGEKMIHSEKERAMKCTSCDNIVYPRIMPAVIVGVTNGNQLLITKYRKGYQHNALVAGFTEIGETVEETVVREVYEEVGLRVKNIRYYKSQPWGAANDILMGFYCDVDGETDIVMDEKELRYAEWVEREQIELQPTDYSLTNEMMKMFKNGAQNK